MRISKFVHFPTIEFEYSKFKLRFGSPTFIWIGELTLQIITTLSSAFSLFSVIVDRLFMSKIKATGKAPTISYLFGYFLKMIVQIASQTLFLFMILWMILFHKRWENFREFMSRNYSADSLVVLSGFLLISALVLTTFGRGWICDFLKWAKE